VAAAAEGPGSPAPLEGGGAPFPEFRAQPAPPATNAKPTGTRTERKRTARNRRRMVSSELGRVKVPRSAVRDRIGVISMASVGRLEHVPARHPEQEDERFAFERIEWNWRQRGCVRNVP
jgi:hypothetical protein